MKHFGLTFSDNFAGVPGWEWRGGAFHAATGHFGLVIDSPFSARGAFVCYVASRSGRHVTKGASYSPHNAVETAVLKLRKWIDWHDDARTRWLDDEASRRRNTRPVSAFVPRHDPLFEPDVVDDALKLLRIIAGWRDGDESGCHPKPYPGGRDAWELVYRPGFYARRMRAKLVSEDSDDDAGSKPGDSPQHGR